MEEAGQSIGEDYVCAVPPSVATLAEVGWFDVGEAGTGLVALWLIHCWPATLGLTRLGSVSVGALYRTAELFLTLMHNGWRKGLAGLPPAARSFVRW
jgi:hypothetical protein